MNRSCLKHSVIPGTSRLFIDYLYHFDRLRNFYGWDPWNLDSFRQASAEIDFPDARRKQTAAALRELNPGNENIGKLERPGGVAIVTGQQVGLFSGPAYTVYKAATAARLARQLTDEGIPAAPVFWLATEDHDVAEVDHVWTLDSATAPVKLQAKVAATGGPAGLAVMEDIPLDELARTLDGLPYADDVLRLVRRAYRPGATLGAAFLELVREVLKPLGLIFVDPLQPAFREIAAPLLATAVERAPELMHAVNERSRELETAGYHAQVFVDKETSPVFLLDNGRRVPFKLKDGHFVHKRATYSAADLEKRAVDISPSALLRPVMQDYVLPTAAYVGGPAEIAYFAQCQPIYERLLGRMPVIVPRNGFTLLDDRTVKTMETYHMDPVELLCPADELRSRVASRIVPSGIRDELAEAHRNVTSTLAKVEQTLAAFDPTLKASLVKSSAKIQYQLAKISKKTEREIFRRDERAVLAAERLSNVIYPHQHLQERMYTILPFLAQFGTGLVSRLYEATQLACPDHMVRAVSKL